MGEASQVRAVRKRRGVWWWLAISVLVGLVTTMAVAWVPVGTGMVSTSGGSPTWVYRRGTTQVGKRDVPGAPVPNCVLTTFLFADRDSLNPSSDWVRRASAGEAPGWALDTDRLGLATKFAVLTSVSGWPMPAVRSYRVASVGTDWQHTRQSGAWAWDGNSLSPRALPYIPYWPGLLVDTATFGSPIFLVGCLMPRLGRLHRRRRGACQRCGYSLAGLAGAGIVCPECGAAA
jgi:hypothetical protein